MDAMLIFDLDGTLWNSSQQVADSWNIILKEYDPSLPPFTAKDIYSVMGRTMEEISDALLSGREIADRRALFRRMEEYEVEYISRLGGVLYPDVSETIRCLHGSGYAMSVVSNCQRGYVNSFFVSMDMGQYFCDSEEWGNTGRLKADNIRLVMERDHVEKAVYIGDTAGDEASAHEAGIPFIHAAYGFGTAVCPEAVIGSFKELPDAAARVIKDHFG